MRPITTILALFALVLLCGCSTQARTPWGNVDFKGGSGSECSPYVAPDGGSGHTLRRPAPMQPVAPVAPVQPVAPIGKIVEETGTPIACLD